MKRINKIGCSVIFLLVAIPLIIGTIFAFQNADELGATPEGKLAKELGLQVDEAYPILDILETVGIADYTKIEPDELLNNAHSEGEKGYRINTRDASNVILYVNENSNVHSIKYLDNILYYNGEIKSSIKDFVLTDIEKIQLQSQAESVVKDVLKSPSTAIFPKHSDWKIGMKDGKKVIQSYVDSQNSFGAMIRSEFQFIIEKDKVVSFIFDGKEYMQ